jgi:uncharacterized protein (DUF885 family)
LPRSCFSGASSTQAQAPPPAASTRLHALFEEDWQRRLREQPEFATLYGDHRYDDRLTDASPDAIARREADDRQMLARVLRIPRDQLQGEDRVSYDVFVHQKRLDVEAQRFPALRTRVLSAIGGAHLDFDHLVQAMPMRTPRDAENLLARMAAFPQRVHEHIALLREGKRLGWVTHRPSLERVPAQIDAQLVDDARRSPLFAPFAKLPAEWQQAQRTRLAAAGEKAVREQVQPALRELRRVVVDELLPASPASGAMSGYPKGREIYDFQVRRLTTTSLGVQAIHDLGQREVARLRAEMEAVMASSGFKGGFADYVQHLNTDPQYFYTRAEDLLAGYRDIAKRVDPELPKLFAELPRTPYGIRPIPPYQGPGAAENYTPGSADGTRSGWFNANTVALSTRPKWEMEALFLHEAVPGHHLQSARALELGKLPAFRRSSWIVAYGEGWALYAEGLGESLGLYSEPASRFGRYRMDIWRAARLVVDTGIHALGWSREQAIDWMSERTGIARASVTAEVDRYYVWPGQALGYKIGQLKIVELRDKARAALGDRFDIRRFHMVLLDHGAVPLTVLEALVDEWIARENAARPPALRSARGRDPHSTAPARMAR